MNLQIFLNFVSDGAYYVFDGIISRLSNTDIKALRLVMKSISYTLFPYMFKRLFLSVHDADLEVFRRVVQHPVACRNIIQICWDGTFCQSDLAGRADTGPMSAYAQKLTGTKRSRIDLQTLTELNQTEGHRYDLRSVLDLWAAQAESSERNTVTAVDVILLKSSLSRMPNLRQIHLLSRRRRTRVDSASYLHFWPTPRAREWEKLPFNKYMLDPLPSHPAMEHDERESIRSVRGLIALCEEGCTSIGSIIVAPFGHQTATSMHSHRGGMRVRGGLDFPSIDVGAATVTDTNVDDADDANDAPPIMNAVDSGNLTLRLMIEATPRDSTTYATATIWETHINLLISTARHTLHTLSLHDTNLDRMADRLESHATAFDSPHPLTTCTALRTLRLSAGWTTDPTRLLLWIHHNTAIRRLALHAVYSARVSWQTVLTNLRAEGVVFDALDLVSCRSPAAETAELFSPDILAPWNGESSRVVPWLSGETNEFPLWQGPG